MPIDVDGLGRLRENWSQIQEQLAQRIDAPYGVYEGRSLSAQRWGRGLIRPPPEWGVAHIDWSQQEFGIAAALSGDEEMENAYASGDPYLAFGQQAGAIPPEGTKASHGPLREQLKACVLATQYGMGRNRWRCPSGSRQLGPGNCCDYIGRPSPGSGPGRTASSTTPP